MTVVDSDPDYNTTETVETTITTSKTRILTPDGATSFFLYHKTADATVHIGGSDVDTTGKFMEVETEDRLEYSSMQENDGNEIYGIVSSGTVVVYATGVIKE